MTNCERISERMPEAARGGAPWSVDQERHLAGCESCRLEWALVRQTAQLGRTAIPRVDDRKVAEALLLRLRDAGPTVASGPGHRRRAWIMATLAAAAALVLVIWGRSRQEQPRPMTAVNERVLTAEPVQTAQLSLPIPELEDLEAEQLDTVLKLLDEPFQADELIEATNTETPSAFERDFTTSEG